MCPWRSKNYSIVVNRELTLSTVQSSILPTPCILLNQSIPLMLWFTQLARSFEKDWQGAPKDRHADRI
jgi:hypothetical protein